MLMLSIYVITKLTPGNYLKWKEESHKETRLKNNSNLNQTDWKVYIIHIKEY